MSSPDKPSDDTLGNLYRQRKATFKAPATIKRQMLLQHQTMINSRQVWRRLGNVAVAASTLLLIGLVYWNHYSLQQRDTNLIAQQFTTIELHSLAPSKQSEVISERYAKHYQEYLAQQTILVLHHKKQAVLHQVDNGWQLQTCDQQVVQISQDLINALRNIHQIEGTFKTGDNVEMMFDKNGLILGIKPGPKLAHC